MLNFNKTLPDLRNSYVPELKSSFAQVATEYTL
jgi:hypothetical protein